MSHYIEYWLQAIKVLDPIVIMEIVLDLLRSRWICNKSYINVKIDHSIL